MKIVLQTGISANKYIREAIFNALRANPDYQVYLWDSSGKSVFDLFHEIPDIDIFLFSGWEISKAIVKNLVLRPDIKVGMFAESYGCVNTEIDLRVYPVGVASEEQIRLTEEIKKVHPELFVITQHGEKWKDYTHGFWKGKLGCEILSLPTCADIIEYFPTPLDNKYKVDCVYLGNYWKYKADSTLDKYLLPLCYPNSKLKVKIFGGGFPYVNFLGRISVQEINKFYRNAGFVPSFGEKHSYDCYEDVPQRYWQVSASYGFQIAPRMIGLEDAFKEDEIVLTESYEDYREKIDFYLKNPEETIRFRKNGYYKIMSNHTNFHRAISLLLALKEDINWFSKQLEINYKNAINIVKSMEENNVTIS